MELPRPKGPKGMGPGGGPPPINRHRNAIKHPPVGQPDHKINRMDQGCTIQQLMPFRTYPYGYFLDAAGITSLIMAPNANLNSTPVGSSNSVTATTASLGVTTNSVTSNVTTPTSLNQDKKDLVNNSHVADGATDSTKLSNSSAVNNSAEARHYSPSTSPPKSNNLVAVNT